MSEKLLKITVPENLEYEGVFDEILKKHTLAFTLNKVKTVDMGSLFELDYNIVVGKNFMQKQFIDELRCRNGNLTISLIMKADEGEF